MAGRPGENTKSSRLASLLRERGFRDADFERHFTIFDQITGKRASRKPDVVFSNGGTNIISAKDGAHLEREAITTAIQYLRDLAPATTLGEVFALTYPRKGEQHHLHVLPSGSRQEVSLVLESLEEVADTIVQVVRGRIAELEQRQEPVQDEVGRILQFSASELAETLYDIPESDLEDIFGGHDFFYSTLATVLQGEERIVALHLGVSYLFINQILFYVLLSRACGGVEPYPSIDRSDYGSPERLRDNYFQLVRKRDYEPIYGPDVARHFTEGQVGSHLSELVETIVELAPKLTVPDLVGQIFQRLIPFQIRKPLGAHYTNPKAAALLARLVINHSDATVFDPACGSGTLLVAAYRRKFRMTRLANAQTKHKQFVEKDITGVDAMAFSAHLAAVNLALQQPLLETDFVRIGRADSTRLKPGMEIQTAGEALPEEFRQSRLEDDHAALAKKRNTSRVPSLKTGSERSIPLTKVDVVIMNPPFTSQNNLAPEYRLLLKKRFASTPIYKKIAFWKTSQQVYFMLLADRFLKDGSRIAAVLPFTTFTGHAFHPLVRFLAEHYTVEAIIVGLGRASFSEDTSLMECLFVARKRRPAKESSFKLVGIVKRPENWAEADLEQIARDIIQTSSSKLGVIQKISQTELLPENSTLSTLMLRLDHDYDAAWTKLQEIFQRSSVHLIKLKELFERGVVVTEVYHGEYRPLRVGPKAILGSRTRERAIKSIDRMVLDSTKGTKIQFVDRMNPEAKYQFPKTNLAVSIRRFSYLNSFDITNKTDFIVAETSPYLDKAMQAFYSQTESRRHLRNIKRAGWRKIIRRGSARTNIVARANLAAPGTMWLAYRSDEPAFLAGAYGYNVKGFQDEKEEKLFTMWFNSSMALIELLGKATITEGSWVKLEKFTSERITMPDPKKLTKKQWQRIEKLWDDLKQETVPSLMGQLEDGDPVREHLDEGLFRVLGLPHTEAQAAGTILRRGALSAIRMLVKTMG